MYLCASYPPPWTNLIVCVFTGTPLPRVTWNVRGDDPAVDDRGYPIDDETVTNVLRIDRIHRDSHGKLLICEASNVPDVVQLTMAVVMDVYRKYYITEYVLFFTVRLSTTTAD